MCILLTLHNAKFGVSDLLFFESYRRKTFGGGGGGRLDPSLGKERVNIYDYEYDSLSLIQAYELSLRDCRDLHLIEL